MASNTIRPKILLTSGRVQQPLRVSIMDGFAIDPIKTFLTADNASGLTTLTVKDISGFAINQILLIGQPGVSGSEIIKTHASTAPTGSTITLASATVFPHSSSTFVYVLKFDQVEFSSAATVTGSKSVISAASNILADQLYTEYNDTAATAGFYFARFKETIGSTFGAYSDAAPVAGYGLYSARAIIDGALGKINKKTSEVLSDQFMFQELDNFQTDVLKELKRWSFMESFNQILGQAGQGSWKVAVPSTLDDQNTNKSIYNIRLGKNGRMTWVDKEKWDELIGDLAFTTLASTLSVGATSMVLTNSSDFGTSGTVTIGAYTYTFSANNTSTNTLTITAVASGQNQASGADVFLNPSSGLPSYWTIWGDGNIYYWPLVGSTYAGQNLYGDFYTSQNRITSDYSNIVVPDPLAAQYYLCAAALTKLANGDPTPAAQAFEAKYLERRKKLVNKETLGRTFKMKPRIQNYAIQSQISSNDSKEIRSGNFSNTGF